MERKISEWLRMIADPEIRKNAWENWKNRDAEKCPDEPVESVEQAIDKHAIWKNTPQFEEYWHNVFISKIILLHQPIPEAEMDALNTDPLNGGQKIIDDLKDYAVAQPRYFQQKHEEMRRKLWCDVAANLGDAAIADLALNEFDKRFPNHIN